VIAGLQDMDSGARLRPGVVVYQTPADVDRQLLNLRRSNLLITTRGGVTLRRPCPQRYRGGHAWAAPAGTGPPSASAVITTSSASKAAQVRDAAIIRLGLQDIAHLNNP